MSCLHFSFSVKMVAALLAIVAMVGAGIYLASCLLDKAASAIQVDTFGKRLHFLFSTATAPAFLAIPLIVPFRIPRSFVEVVLVPLIVALAGTIALHCGSTRKPTVGLLRQRNRFHYAIRSLFWWLCC